MLPKTSLTWVKWISIHRLAGRRRKNSDKYIDYQQRLQPWRRRCSQQKMGPTCDNPSSQTLQWRKKINGIFFLVGNHSIWWVYGNVASTTNTVELRTTHSSVLYQFSSFFFAHHFNWDHLMRYGHLFQFVHLYANGWMRIARVHTSQWEEVHIRHSNRICVCVWRNVHDSMRAENTQNHLLHSSFRFLFGSVFVETCEMIHEWCTWNENSMICCHIFRNWNVNKVEALATRCRLYGSSSISGSCDRYNTGMFSQSMRIFVLSVFVGSWTNDTRIFEQFYHCYSDVSSFFIGLL